MSRHALTIEDSESAIARYVTVVTPHFDVLKAIATQLAGFLLSATLDPKVADDDGPLDHADEMLAQATDALRSIDVSDRTGHHHHHMLQAIAALRRALALMHLAAARRDTLAAECERPLNAAIAHLRHASAALPGLEIVDLSGACCAWHPGTPSAS